MTHEYTLLIRGTILAGTGQPPASAIAWAGGVVLALGTDAQVLGVSRGDSHVIELHGAFVVPIAEDASPTWPPSGTLEIGGPADFALLGGDPRVPGDHPPRLVGVVRGGDVVGGSLAPPPRRST